MVQHLACLLFRLSDEGSVPGLKCLSLFQMPGTRQEVAANASVDKGTSLEEALGQLSKEVGGCASVLGKVD